MSFSTLGLAPGLLRSIDSRGYTAPTGIQAEAIAAAVAGRDVLGCAATGSGKTAAFLLPILNNLIVNPRRGTRALILAPTRELACQIVDEAALFAKGTNIRSAVIVGGLGMRPQEQALRSGVDIVVATPGRLLDHLRYNYVRLDTVEHLVLDEADRMLDMGFLPDVRRILSHVPKSRQTLFFSATVPPEIGRLASEMLSSPARIGAERKAAPAASITQHLYPVASGHKAALLVALLQQNVIGGEALAFTRTKHRADRLAKFLSEKGIRADRIHGNRSQGQRTAALDAFKTGKLRVLVATDIAARGIDVASLGHVVNFDIPNRSEDYIHRVGRTGRAAATGDAFTFVAPEDEGDMRIIERALGGASITRCRLEGFDYNAPIARPMPSSPSPSRGRSSAPGQGRGGQGNGRGNAGSQGRGNAGSQGRGNTPRHGAGHVQAGSSSHGAAHDSQDAGRGGAPASRTSRSFGRVQRRG